MTPHWKKIDKNALPERVVIYLNHEEWAEGVVKPTNLGIDVFYEGRFVLASPTHYLDPYELPPPGEVRLDWHQHGMREHYAIYEGMMFRIKQGYLDQPFEVQVSKSGIAIETSFIDLCPTLIEAKAACERYAAELLNQESKPEK